MATPAHKGNTKTFDQLTFGEQAKSISAMINNLESAIKRHAKNLDHNPAKTKAKCVRQVHTFLGRLLEK
jgi:hypothetical protein